MNYTLPTSVNIDGIEHPIRSDYRVILDIISALNDDDFTDREKAIAMMRESDMSISQIAEACGFS